MSTQPFRWRTVIEVAVISIIVYVLVGAPGFPASLRTAPTDHYEDVPVAKAKTETLVYPTKDLKCSRHDYNIHVFSSSPLVIYIDGFLSKGEADHFVDISADKWQVSTVFNAGVESTNDSVRKSEKALIDRDEVVQCIEQRALSIQGWPRDTFIERLWTQRYNVTGHYAHHYDWASGTKQSRRVSTFMVYLGDDCEGGGTNFPKLQRPSNDNWCRYLECDGSSEGVTFTPRKGSAVFWMNFDDEGRGYKETIHAGMPVNAGTKIGLNIWSRYQMGHVVPS